MIQKSPATSRAETLHLVLPGQTNAIGTLFGGTVMQWIDEIAAAAAQRHAGGTAVTVAVDALHFIAPIQMGDLVVLKAQVNAVGKSSMEIGVRVEVEDPRTGVRKKTTKAYLTFVAIDPKGSPREVPSLMLESDEDRRREVAAQTRRRNRLATARGGA